ncbi:MAG: acyl-CoA thioesterase [Planctomycetes bacterium]|nr:acyl-CoA thioesterase [Planctomycetota bacterium]
MSGIDPVFPSHPNAFVHRRLVEFCETDAAGIAHFSALMQYMEQAEHALLRSVGTTVFSLQAETVTWPRVHVRADFLSTASFEDSLLIYVSIQKLGVTSITYAFEVIGPRGTVAEGISVSVCCVRSADASQGLRKISIPGELRDSLARYLQPS